MRGWTLAWDNTVTAKICLHVSIVSNINFISNYIPSTLDARACNKGLSVICVKEPIKSWSHGYVSSEHHKLVDGGSAVISSCHSYLSGLNFITDIFSTSHWHGKDVFEHYFFLSFMFLERQQMALLQ